MSTQGQTYYLQIRPNIPPALKRLEEISSDMWFSWNAKARMLFRLLDNDLWTRTGHNPRLFLRRISQNRLNEISTDRAFITLFNGVLADYDSYQADENQWFINHIPEPESHSIAYFSAEFGLHESLPIYSGGLGILAGDHCKSASDLGLPFTAVGLLYRKGYFTQTIDAHGNQVATYYSNRFADLCVEEAKNTDGEAIYIAVELPGRALHLKVWTVSIGHIQMVLLDSDLDKNSNEDRTITHQLYGGGVENRVRQEIVLGIGGVRALRAMGIAPTVWHLNEGHAAFVSLERMREYVQHDGLSFDESLDAAASCTIFTTHTPVPAGHDVFPHDMFDHYMGHYADKLGISIDRLHGMGHGDFGHGSHGFNQTALATHTSAHQNGVAKLHGEVSSRMFQGMWPDLTPEENPMSSVTNGVHTLTWLAQEWISAFDQELGGSWRGHLRDPDFWDCIHNIPDHLFWSIHQTNKGRMLQYIAEQLEEQAIRNGESLQMVTEMTQCFDVRHLVIGFARRFATYKRATLLFNDESRLLSLLDAIGQPVIFLFAGKAHPADEPGQDLIRQIHHISRKPAFKGRILMLEGYDMTLSRYMLSGVDVWLNNPRRPMEASGTSGMKAAMNGAPNLSILDGWWPEGYKEANGWVIGGERDIEDDQLRDQEDAASLYHVLANHIAPLYYQLDDRGYSKGWVHTAKRAMIEAIPVFNTERMVAEYTERFYIPASNHGQAMVADGFARSKGLATWKNKVRSAWDGVYLEANDVIPCRNTKQYGDDISVSVKAHLNGLTADEVSVEVLLLRPTGGLHGDYEPDAAIALKDQGDGIFTADIHPEDTGDFAYRVRVYPTHEDLPHPLAMGLMKYL